MNPQSRFYQLLVLLCIYFASQLPSYAATPEENPTPIPSVSSRPIDPTLDPDAMQQAISLLKQSKAVALMRHALAPGFSDPDSFSLDDCTTQRNLSEAGRQQASALGKSLKDNGLTSGEIYSSQWCRCLETAELLMLGQVQPADMLNSIFLRSEQRESKTKQLSSWIQKRLDDNTSTTLGTILVTHQANISALLGGSATSGELLIVGNVKNELVVLMRLLIPS